MLKISTMSRREREEESRRALILDAAEFLFSRRGLHSTAVSDIAREAEFGIGTIYKYYTDKQALIQALLEDRLKIHFQALSAALDRAQTPMEALENIMEAYFETVYQHRDFFSMFYTHFHPGPRRDPQSGSLNLDFLQEWKLRLIDDIRRVFQSGIDIGLFVNIDPDYLAAAFWGILISFFCFGEVKFLGEWDVIGMKAAAKKILFENVLVSTAGTF